MDVQATLSNANLPLRFATYLERISPLLPKIRSRPRSQEPILITLARGLTLRFRSALETNRTNFARGTFLALGCEATTWDGEIMGSGHTIDRSCEWLSRLSTDQY